MPLLLKLLPKAGASLHGDFGRIRKRHPLANFRFHSPLSQTTLCFSHTLEEELNYLHHKKNWDQEWWTFSTCVFFSSDLTLCLHVPSCLEDTHFSDLPHPPGCFLLSPSRVQYKGVPLHFRLFHLCLLWLVFLSLHI